MSYGQSWELKRLILIGFLLGTVSNSENTFLRNYNFLYISTMSAFLIKTDPKNSKLLSELAKQLGGEVLVVKDEQVEDLMLGMQMDATKTGKTVPKKAILKKLGTK